MKRPVIVKEDCRGPSIKNADASCVDEVLITKLLLKMKQ
jgi:hypothetical protein